MAVDFKAYQVVSGFDERLIAGEDPDFVLRLVGAGWRAIRVDVPMATHDAGILTFREWWQRSVRAGHALAHRDYLARAQGRLSGARELISTAFWSIALPITAIVLLLLGIKQVVMIALLYLLLFARIVSYHARNGETMGNSILAARYNVVAKFANMAGVARFYQQQKAGAFSVVDYKQN